MQETRISPKKPTIDLNIKKNQSFKDKLDMDDSDDDDFDIPLNKFRKVHMPTKKLAEKNFDDISKMTSSPKPISSRIATRLCNLDDDSDSMSENNKVNKSKSKKTPKKPEVKSQDEEEEEENKSKTVNKSKKKTQTIKKDTSFSSFSDVSDESDNESKVKVKMNESSAQGKRVKWTENETIYLVVGVELYGKGNWAKISKRFNDKLKNRTTVHLKDKYRNLEKANSELKRFEKIAKTLIEKNDLK